jgi:hypothetical protein
LIDHQAAHCHRPPLKTAKQIGQTAGVFGFVL